MVLTGLLRRHRNGRLPVLIIAPDRERRLACVSEFHRAGPLRHGPLVALDCCSDEEALESALLTWASSRPADAAAHPLWSVAQGTLFLDRIPLLGQTGQRLLLDLVRRDRAPHGIGRLVCGCEQDPETAVARGSFSLQLLDCLDKVRIHLDPIAPAQERGRLTLIGGASLRGRRHERQER